MSTEALLLAALAWAVYPAWLLAGALDFVCHRAMRIERNAGTRESGWHLVQLALVGVPIVLGLFLEITALLLAIALAALVLHTLAAYADTRVAAARRAIPPFEQHVHAALDALPAVAFGIVAVLHWPQAAALAGLADGDWTLRPRATPLPWTAVAAVLGPAFVLAIVPAWLEWRRCRRFALARQVAGDRRT